MWKLHVAHPHPPSRCESSVTSATIIPMNHHLNGRHRFISPLFYGWIYGIILNQSQIQQKKSTDFRVVFPGSFLALTWISSFKTARGMVPRPESSAARLHQVSKLSLRVAAAQQAAGTLTDQLIHGAVLEPGARFFTMVRHSGSYRSFIGDT